MVTRYKVLFGTIARTSNDPFDQATIDDELGRNDGTSNDSQSAESIFTAKFSGGDTITKDVDGANLLAPEFRVSAHWRKRPRKHRATVASQIRPDLAHDQHRQVRMRDDFRCLAAEEQASKPATTMRSHDDQVATIVLGHLQNTFGRVAVSHMDSGELDALAFHQLDRSIEDTVCARCSRLFEFLDEVLISALGERRHFHSGPWLCHRHNGDQCAGAFGEATAVDKTLGCKLRSVGGNKDMLVHDNAFLSISNGFTILMTIDRVAIAVST